MRRLYARALRPRRGDGMKEIEYQAVWPSARTRRRGAVTNQLPDDLRDVVIGFVWNYAFRGPEIFSVIREQLEKSDPGMGFVDYPAFGDIHGLNEDRVVADLPDRFLEYRANAGIVGVGA